MNDQFELYENARKRLKQKKKLYAHFVIFLIGSVFLIFINKVLKIGEPHDWFVWAIIAWLFLLIFHFINVFVTDKFMGKDWERKQIEKLVDKQEKKIKELSKKIEKETQLEINEEKPSNLLDKPNDNS